MRYAVLVALIALCGLAIRVGLACCAVAVTRDAAGKYLPLAQAWQQGEPAKAFAGALPPLYPIVTGLLARVAGDVEVAGRVVSIAGGMLVLLFVFLLAYRLAGRWTACVALALVAFHPYLCQFSGDVGPDSLAAGLLAGLVYAVCAYLLTFSFWNVVLAAGAMAGLALVRPEGFAYAPLALGVMLAWPIRRTADAETTAERERGTGGQGERTAEGETSRQGDKEGTADGRATAWRRALHVGVLVLILAGLCVPRLISVHKRTGVWALDTRQRTWTTRIWSALRSGEPQYGQWRIWSRGGWQAVGDTVGSTVAGFGPAAMVFGVYGLIVGRWLRRRRVAMVIALFVAYSFVLILVGNRISKRYLLGAAALWQVWGAIGIVRLCQGVEGSFLRRAWAAIGCGGRGLTPGAPRLWALPMVAGLVIACLQLPWVPQRIGLESMADRHMGEWMAANLPAGTPVLAMESVPLWYGRAVKVNLPTFKPNRLTPTGLALMAGQVKTEYILVDSRGPVWCPGVWGTLEKGDWPYGRILHRQSERKHTLYLLEVSRAGQTAIDAMPRKRAAPAGTQPASPVVRHPKGQRVAVMSQPAKDTRETTTSATD